MRSIVLEILKTYIKTNLANSFIQLSKSAIGAPIFFNKKPDCNVVATWLCHMISLVITLNDIPLSPPIALTYHFCSWRLAFSIHQTSFIYLLGIDSPSSHCRNAPSRHPYCHPTIFPFVEKRPSLIWFRWELDFLL